jgi:hypothetical protein
MYLEVLFHYGSMNLFQIVENLRHKINIRKECQMCFNHMLNIELDLQSLCRLLCTAVHIG